MFLNSLGNIFASREANFVSATMFPQQCFHGWANRETFEETSRITNVSTTMFPSLSRAFIVVFSISIHTTMSKRNVIMSVRRVKTFYYIKYSAL